MKGDWLMIRLKPRGGEKNENWLLRKIDDAYAGASGDLVERALTSVVTGRSMAEIAAGKDGKAVRQSDRARPATHRARHARAHEKPGGHSQVKHAESHSAPPPRLPRRAACHPCRQRTDRIGLDARGEI